MLVARAAPASHGGELARELLGEPVARLGPECIVFRRISQVHAGKT
jgi:hypothetical protein